MSTALTYNFSVPHPKVGYKGLNNVFSESVPGWSRPATNGYSPNSDSGKGCVGRARPIKHWRKQLMPTANSGSNRATKTTS